MQSDQTAANTVDVSVVVIGRNEGTRLLDCLRSVHAAHWADLRYELIYPKNGSYAGAAS